MGSWSEAILRIPQIVKVSGKPYWDTSYQNVTMGGCAGSDKGGGGCH